MRSCVAVNKQVRLSSWRKLVMRNRPLCYVLVGLISAAIRLRAEDSTSISPNGDQLPETEPLIVSATRFDIPLDQSPASVSVIDSQDIDNKQIERAADALREVPVHAVGPAATHGQLTSGFVPGLSMTQMPAVLVGIPITQTLPNQ